MDNEPKEPLKHCATLGIFWWTTMVVAVLAVPCLGIVVSYLFPFRGIGGLVIFILACWLSTYLGMKLMANPKMSETIQIRKKKH